MSRNKLCVGVVGAGVISDIYLKNMTEHYGNLKVKAICAENIDMVREKAKTYGIMAMTREEMFADPEIDLVVNLTPPHVHYAIIKEALLCGKHVYTEKTMTDNVEKSAELVALAQEKGLYLGSAPDTFLGAAYQRARAFIDEGFLGEINSFAISGNRNFGPAGENLRGIGPSDLAEAVLCDKPCRPSMEMAYHVHEVLSAMLAGGENGMFIDIESAFTRPEPVDACKVPVKKLAHIAYHVKDMEKMIRFYGDILGLEKCFTLTFRDLYDSVEEEKKALPAGEDPLLDQIRGLGERPWIEYLKLAEGQFVELFYDVERFNSGKTDVDDRWSHYGYLKMNYEVEDIQAFRDHLVNAGVELDEDIHLTVDGARELKIHDPEGNEVLIVQYPEPGTGILSMEDAPGFESCSKVNCITQAAYQVKDELNMLNYYIKGLGLKHAARLTFGDLADSLEKGKDKSGLIDELRQKADQPWIDYIEAAPHQYIELFYTGGLKKEEALSPDDHYGYQHICFEVQDIRATWDAVTANGLKPDTEISLGCDHTWQFWLKDPDGNRMEFHEYTESSRQL